MTTTENKAMRRALVTVTAIFIILVAVVFAVTSNEVNSIRGDFCDFAAQAVGGSRQLPQVPGRVQIEHAYARLQARLNC